MGTNMWNTEVCTLYFASNSICKGHKHYSLRVLSFVQNLCNPMAIGFSNRNVRFLNCGG